MKLSVVMACKDSDPASLKSSIMSVLKQTYSTFEDNIVDVFTKDKIYSTAFRQFGGNLVDFSFVSKEANNIDLKESFFPTILQGFLPSSIRDTFFESYFSRRANYGKIFAQSIGQENNALRLNFTNEVFFSFGIIGVILYSLLVGFLLSYFSNTNLISSRCISLFFISQLLSLHILGLNTLSNSVILTLIYIYIINSIKVKKHGFNNYS